ncbi:GIN domain-containing protein [Saccharicrinis aurantiacus]|uniref:GIN domain-containing protein n=1 Tax=Saccharicrinis aurantiacus TaxID=1849719 RepID=UPI0024925BF8|nr:DUF2807 domain-containing protein [Saccharicrinis aurantiacus]
MLKLVSIVLMVQLVFQVTLSQKIEHRAHDEFSIIKVKSGIKVFITQADTFSIIVKCNRSSIHRIITEQINNSLTIYTKGKYRWGNNELREVHITAPYYLALTAESGSDITSMNRIEGDIVFIRASSGSDVYCNLSYTTAKVNVKNGASISLSGAVRNLNVKAESSGHVFNKKLIAEYANLSVGLGSVIEVYVSDWLVATSKGGEIKYKGAPKNVEVVASNGGDVIRF